MKNFKVEAEGAEFEFISMHVKEGKAFQVYVMNDGVKRRFHKQRDDEGEFYITNKDHCPTQYHKSEELLGKAIIIYGSDSNYNNDIGKRQAD